MVPDSTAQYFKKLYEHELSTQTNNANIVELHFQKRGTPTLLLIEIDDMVDVDTYLFAIRSNVSAVNSIIIKAVARGLLLSYCKHLMKKWRSQSSRENSSASLFGFTPRSGTNNTKSKMLKKKKVTMNFSFRSGELMPTQLINKDKTDRCYPDFASLSGWQFWHITQLSSF